MQAHLNVEAVRHWANPTHWGDTLLFFLRRRAARPRPRRRSGRHACARSAPTTACCRSATTCTACSTSTSSTTRSRTSSRPATTSRTRPSRPTSPRPMAADWLARTTPAQLHRAGAAQRQLHRRSAGGHPWRRALQARATLRANLGFRVYTCGRHAGGHMHPETIDAMDYLYANEPDHRRLHLQLLPHDRVRRAQPGCDGRRHIGGKPLTYVTDVRRTIATQGIWFPFHPVVTTDDGMAAAARLGPHPRVRCRLRTGRDDLRRPQLAAARRGRPAGERRLQLPVPPRAGARSVRQRRQGHARLCPLRHQPGRAPQLLDRQPARALPAHGGLRGPALPGATTAACG